MAAQPQETAFIRLHHSSLCPGFRKLNIIHRAVVPATTFSCVCIIRLKLRFISRYDEGRESGFQLKQNERAITVNVYQTATPNAASTSALLCAC